MNGGDIPKQRGIYSEILTTEDTENLKVLTSIYNILIVSVYYWTFTEQRNISKR